MSMNQFSSYNYPFHVGLVSAFCICPFHDPKRETQVDGRREGRTI